MARPDHFQAIPVNRRALVMNNVDFRDKNDFPVIRKEPAAPVHIAEKHGEGFIQKPDLVQRFPMCEQKGALGLFHVLPRFVIESAHFPVIEFTACREQQAQSQRVVKHIAPPGQSPARGLNGPIRISELGRDNADSFVALEHRNQFPKNWHGKFGVRV